MFIHGKEIARDHVDQSGFTIIEVLICIAIFAIGTLAIAGLQTKAMSVDLHSRLLTDAYKVATDQAEEILLWDYSDARLDPNDTTDPTDFYDRGLRGVGNRYQLSYIVDQIAGEPNMKSVIVRAAITNSSVDPVSISFLKTPIQDIYQ